MDWNELLQWSQKGFIACCALVVQLTLTLIVNQDARVARTHRLTGAQSHMAAHQAAGSTSVHRLK